MRRTTTRLRRTTDTRTTDTDTKVTGKDRTRQDTEDRRGQGRTGQDRRGQDRTEQDRTGQDRTGQDRTGQDRAGQHLDTIAVARGRVDGRDVPTILRMGGHQLHAACDDIPRSGRKHVAVDACAAVVAHDGVQAPLRVGAAIHPVTC